MKETVMKRVLLSAWVLAMAVGCSAPPKAPLVAAKPAPTSVAEAPMVKFHTIVNADFVAKYAIIPKPQGVMLIDSRPTGRKFDPGHIPTAINIPDSAFDKMIDRLPGDKSTLLIFYCEGETCVLSHNSAAKAEKLGYSNVKVYAAGYPDWVAKGNMSAVSVAFIKKQLDAKAPLLLVDSRPKDRKYDKGHIPGAISIPDSAFDKMVDKLPADKGLALYFYCEGMSCVLSSNSAAKALALGYKNVKVVPEGYPGWVAAYGAGPVVAAAPVAPVAPVVTAAAVAPASTGTLMADFVAGKEPGSLQVSAFEKLLVTAPDSMRLIDVRDPHEFSAGTFKGASNVPINSLEKRIESLPADKPIVFFCGAGGRGGEAHDMAKLLRSELKTWFLNADITFSKDGSAKIVEKK
jgi:rhodanese-related sulfurtransferase